jgi:hypothetical protein
MSTNLTFPSNDLSQLRENVLPTMGARPNPQDPDLYQRQPLVGRNGRFFEPAGVGLCVWEWDDFVGKPHHNFLRFLAGG